MEQNQSSAPWLRPSNTICNTDGWRRTRKTTSKITVRSAKKQERLKKIMERKTKVLLGLTSRRPCSRPSWPMMCLQGQASLLPPRALPPPHLPHPSHPPPWRSVALQTSQWPADLSQPGEVSVKAGFGGAERQVWRSLCWVSRQLSKGREHRQDVLVIIMAPMEMSVVQSLCVLLPAYVI